MLNNRNKNTYKGFSKIDRVLTGTAKAYNLEAALIKHQALKHWQEIAGNFVEEAKELSRAIGFEKGVLTVACLTKDVASKIKLLASRIIEGLNNLLGRRVIFAIYVEV